ncbi:probable transcription factor PosF21 isoform X2 [Zingiber officinale]|nr:probable transcription factor PosF21 isoform X2 [Zingiber officinale]XP_042422290.1 probable transcription factor PosF21 isoform X2 [Zingiber officinale]
MDKEKWPVPGGGAVGGGNAGGLPPQSSRYALFASPSDSCRITNDPSSSSSQPPDSGQFGYVTPSDTGRFSYDVSRMPDCPPKNSGHRRAHSEILSLPDDLSFGSDLGVVGSHDGPSLSDETEEDLVSMFIDVEKFSSSATSAGLSIREASPVPALPQGDNVPSGSSEKPRMRHQHSQSLDGTSIKPELLMAGGEGPSSVDVKKAMSAAKLAELALVDPKRAKRILANRQSASRSKERKMRYISELERKVQTLQTEATTLSAQLSMLQRDTNGLTVENNELKLRLQTMEQQVHLQDALNENLRDEVQRLKMATGQMLPSGGQMMNFASSFGANQQYYHHNPAMQSLLATHQLQQLQIRSQHPQQLQPHQTQQHQVQQQLLQLRTQQQQQQQQRQQQQSTTDLRMKGASLPLQNQFGEAPSDDKNTHE